MNILFDLDGTLCDTPAGVDYDDPASLLGACTPRARVLERLHDLAALDHNLGVVTARGPHVSDITKAQLRRWLGPLAERLVVRHRPRLTFDWGDYVVDKQRSIRELGCDVYVGDRAEDKAAALRAGALFLWDHEFEATGLLSLRREVPA
ncbi:MAG: HAD family hydrolase [Candidatus Thermoplasmatota archaeon]|jgi:FMN phosphatase YigB (HAD superfamily)